MAYIAGPEWNSLPISINKLASYFFSYLCHLFLPLQSCRPTRAEGRTDRSSGVLATMIFFTGVSYSRAQGTNLTSGWSAQEQAWTLPLIFPASVSRAEDSCMSLTHSARGIILHLYVLNVWYITGQEIKLLKGSATAQDQRWWFSVRPSSNHTPLQKLLRALSPFLNGLVQLKYERKSNTWTNLCSRLGRLLHLSCLAC